MHKLIQLYYKNKLHFYNWHQLDQKLQTLKMDPSSGATPFRAVGSALPFLITNPVREEQGMEDAAFMCLGKILLRRKLRLINFTNHPQ